MSEVEELLERLRSADGVGFKLDAALSDAADLIERQNEILDQIAMPQTGRTPEQAVAYFQHLARKR